MIFLKRQFPLLLAFVMGVLFIAQYFVPHQASNDLLMWVNKWISVIWGMALFLGVGSLMNMHYAKIRGVMFFALFAAIGAGFIPPVVKLFGAWKNLPTGTQDEGSPIFWIFNHMLNPMQSTMFSILAFFMASAAFRAFRARSLEATLLLISAVIIMLGQVPIGQVIWKEIPNIATQILMVPNTAAKRAIIFGVALGSVATSLRIIIGIERSYLGGKD
jgi:hypothetical protein